MKTEWKFDQEGVNWDELSDLYRVAPLGEEAGRSEPGILK
jgi:hypothetical protein